MTNYPKNIPDSGFYSPSSSNFDFTEDPTYHRVPSLTTKKEDEGEDCPDAITLQEFHARQAQAQAKIEASDQAVPNSDQQPLDLEIQDSCLYQRRKRSSSCPLPNTSLVNLSCHRCLRSHSHCEPESSEVPEPAMPTNQPEMRTIGTQTRNWNWSDESDDESVDSSSWDHVRDIDIAGTRRVNPDGTPVLSWYRWEANANPNPPAVTLHNIHTLGSNLRGMGDNFEEEYRREALPAVEEEVRLPHLLRAFGRIVELLAVPIF